LCHEPQKTFESVMSSLGYSYEDGDLSYDDDSESESLSPAPASKQQDDVVIA